MREQLEQERRRDLRMFEMRRLGFPVTVNTERFVAQRGPNLIRGVGYANVKVVQIGFHEVSIDHFEFLALRSTAHQSGPFLAQSQLPLTVLELAWRLQQPCADPSR